MEVPGIASSQSFEQIEDLVRQLYQPNHSKHVARIQAKLHQWQRSDAGWEVAERLLSNSDANSRFFGALTLTVKLNVDWKKIDTEQGPKSAAILSGLINCLVQFVNPPGRNEPSFVLKKLCSTLATYHSKPVSNWSRCLRQLACSLHQGRYLDEASISDISNFAEIISQLNPLQLQCVLWFSTDLADEFVKFETIEQQKLHERMRDNIDDVKWLIRASLHYGDEQNSSSCSTSRASIGTDTGSKDKLRTTGLSCFVAWSSYIQREWMSSQELLEPMIDLIADALACVFLEVDSAEDILVDWIDNSGPMLRSRYAQAGKERFYELFQSQWAISRVNGLRENAPDSTAFARLLIAFADIEMDALTMGVDSARSRMLLGLLHLLLQCPGAPGDDDEVALLGLEFWASYVESLNEQLFQFDDAPYPAAIQEARQAIQELFLKVRFPPPSVTHEWGSDTKQAFNGFRVDFQDMLQTAYTFLGQDLTRSLTETTTHQISVKDWWSIEASLFCLNALADAIAENIVEDSPEDFMLLTLFNSNLFSDMTADSTIPTRARRTAVELLGQYSSIFERRTQLLPSALNFLFSSLPIANLATGTARSVCTLCSSCRRHLTSELPAFLQHYEAFRVSPTADVFTKEKVIEGIASVIQAVPSRDDQAAYILRLLGFVEDDVRSMLEHVAANRIEEGQIKAHAAMACLASTGRGLQAPDYDFTIDGADVQDSQTHTWDLIQERILRCIDATTQVLDKDPELIEQTCHVLRAGYKEKLPGPFVLPARATTEFVTRSNLYTPRLPYILSTASIFVKSHIDRSEPWFEAEVYPLLVHVLGLMKELDQPSEDPEIAQSFIEVFTTYLSGDLAMVVFKPEVDTQFGLQFTLQAIHGPDILPKRAACSFWSSFLSASSEGNPTSQSIVKEALGHFGTALSDVLVGQICGGAPQSALEYLSVPLTKLLLTNPNAKRLVEQSLTNLLGDGNSELRFAKLKFLRGITGARGTSARKVVTEFWIACRQAAMSSFSAGTAVNPQVIE